MNTSNVRWPDSLWAAATPSGGALPHQTGPPHAELNGVGAGVT